MDWDKLQGEWRQVKDKVKERWARLTDEDLEKLQGKKDQVVAKIQERYGVVREQAQKRVEHWRNSAAQVEWSDVLRNWSAMRDKLKERWGRLSDEDLQRLYAKKDAFTTKIQERYGVSREEAQKQLDQWLEKAGVWLKKGR